MRKQIRLTENVTYVTVFVAETLHQSRAASIYPVCITTLDHQYQH